MLQASSRAHLRTDLSSFVKATAALLGAAALIAAATPADAQMTRAAAVGVYRAPTNTFALDGNFDNLPDVTFPFGQANDIALLGDLAGSGARGPVLYRAGTWIFDLDRDGVPDKTVAYGAASDVPLMGDIDGDGKEDLVLFRGGQWLVNTKADGTTQYQLQFGGSRGDIPLLGDVNGDGQVDLIIYNRGSWHVSLNQKNNVNVSHSHGAGGSEIPLVFDYNGDGKDDLVTYSAGVWSAKSVNGPVATGSFTFGTASDKPLYFGPGAVPNARLDAARFLHQATFGPVDADVVRVQQIGYAAFVDEQINKPASGFPYMPWWPQNRPQTPNQPQPPAPPVPVWPFCLYALYGFGASYNPASPCNCNGEAGTVNQCQRDVYTNFMLQNQLFKHAVSAPDQLRQRVAWALSQILVTSSLQDPIAYPMRNYQQLLNDEAFGKFEDILYQITLSPWMGNYLDMVRNDGSPAAQARGVVPNENYARELLQLYSIGLWELNNDGTVMTDALGAPIPTYVQDDVVQLARAMTGWAYPPLPGQTPAFNRGINYVGSMVAIEGSAQRHRYDELSRRGRQERDGNEPGRRRPRAGRRVLGGATRGRPSEHRRLHGSPADPAARDEQSLAGLRQPDHQRLEQQWSRRARRPARGGSRDPARCRSACAAQPGSVELRQAQGARASDVESAARTRGDDRRRLPARTGNGDGPERLQRADGVQLLPAGLRRAGHEPVRAAVPDLRRDFVLRTRELHLQPGLFDELRHRADCAVGLRSRIAT